VSVSGDGGRRKSVDRASCVFSMYLLVDYDIIRLDEAHMILSSGFSSGEDYSLPCTCK